MILQKILFLFVLCFFLTGCSDKPETIQSETIAPTSVDSTTISHATGFTIFVENGVKKMHILNPFANYEIENTVVLLQKNQSYAAKQNETILTVPIKTIAPMSTTFYTAIKELNQSKSIVAIANSSFVFSPQIQDDFISGKIAQIGDGEQLNIEKLILLYPDVVVVNGYQGGLAKSFLKTREAGIPVIVNYDWKETTPLARAEWIKFFGAIYGQEELADSIFNQIEENYTAYKSKLDTVSYQPKVLFSSSYQGTWYIPGGGSYLAQFLKDAKGTYPWISDNSTGSLPLSMEVVANELLDADIWLDSQSHSLADLKQKDVRYAEFKPFKEGNVYEHDRRRTKAGGDDFWELGALRVDLLLKDYINILHPGIMEDQSLTFFRKLD